MHIGRLVHQYDLNVIVNGICGSSCANYIVTASNNVVVSKGALMGWHGGATQFIHYPFKPKISWLTRLMSLFSQFDEEKEFALFITKFAKEELYFFETIDVNQAVTILGMMPGLNQQRDAILFSYDKKTLKSLGLTIRFEDEV